jgi:hypothetical protein
MHLSFISLTIALLDSSARSGKPKEGIVSILGRADGGPREMEMEGGGVEKLARSHGSCEPAVMFAHGRLLSGPVSHTAAILGWR